ncbi:hypothetical protein ILUMI_19018 [Ignelater luminosus]|uniref:Uncharacterized protein n=1 Tax=Ignelater luminosus TaxID=2038154 RepID=A0A8K0CNY2_IGNLU|nr:hypothetical protein ILUMI_19018 [Ignelater luminosus]
MGAGVMALIISSGVALKHLLERSSSSTFSYEIVPPIPSPHWRYAVSEDATPKPERSDFKKSLSRDCANAYTTTCLKLDIVSWVDKLNEEDDYSVIPGISVIRENGSARANTADLVAELARDFPNDAEARLDAYLLKKGTLGALALGGIAALAGKALMTGLMALMLSAIIGLKSLGGGGGKTTYEIVSKPIYSHSNTHSVSHEEHGGGGHGGGHGGYSSYGRSFDMPLPLGLQPNYQP